MLCVLSYRAKKGIVMISIDKYELTNYLARHGITEYKEKGDEISFSCPFCNGDEDHRNNEEYHFSINIASGVYNCFKCGAKGNLFTLCGRFHDFSLIKKNKNNQEPQLKKKPESLYDEAVAYNQALPDRYRQYFHDRGLNDKSIDDNLLGFGEFNGRNWLVIPIFASPKEVKFFKLRRLPEFDEEPGNKYIFYPAGAGGACLVGSYEASRSHSDSILVCEGELDRIIALQNGINMPVITSTAGANTFKEEWIKEYLSKYRTIYLCFDNDEAGESAMFQHANRIAELVPTATIMQVELPEEVGDKGDITDYVVKQHGDIADLIKSAQYIAGPEPVDLTKMKEMDILELNDILGITISHDDVNRTVVFLAMLTAYTDSSQLNICMIGQSASGKTHIVREVSKLFPKEDVKVYGKITPTGFFYNTDEMLKNEEDGRQVVNLENKILVFTELIDSRLQENLRPVLSHDEKEIPFLITNKDKNGANTAKTGYIRGYPATFFCSTNMRMDQQEITRSLLLSPEITNEKISQAIDLQIEKESNLENYQDRISQSKNRSLLMDRIRDIRAMGIHNVNIENTGYANECFRETLGDAKELSPRHQRDVQHFFSLIKACALLNARFRKRIGNNIVATDIDIRSAWRLWNRISISQLLNLPPQAFDEYRFVIIPAYKEKNEGKTKEEAMGLTYEDIVHYHLQTKGSIPNNDYYRKQIIPVLKQASLISYEKDSRFDGRIKLITPLLISGGNVLE